MAACAQKTVTQPASNLPTGWIHAPSRQENSDLWYCAGYGGSWVVNNDRSGVALTRFDPEVEKQKPIPPKLKLSKEMIGRRSIQPTSNGWLIGFDAGEFGGGLWWFNRAGSRTVKLLSDNVHAIYESSAGILILVGLNHMGLNYGQVYRFTDISVKVATVPVAKLDGSPEASIIEEDGNIIIATDHSVLRLNTDGQISEIYKTEEYLTYPTSAAIDPNGIIYVAMRFFVLRLIPRTDGYKAEWLMPEQCRSLKLDKNICTCNSDDKQPN
jgi:hypothetical protein